MEYLIKNIKDIKLEGTHDLPDSRQTLLNKEELDSESFEAFTKGDIVLIRPNYKHRIMASGDNASEFLFVRLK